MRKQFVRFLLGFVLVILVLQAIQMGVFLLNGRKQQRIWDKGIYEDYVSSLSENLSSNVPEEGWNVNNIPSILLYSADDRISGLLLKDPNGNIVMTFGKTRRGDPIDEGNDDPSYKGKRVNEKITLLQVKDVHEVRAKSDTYVIAITGSGSGILSGYRTVTYKDKVESKTIKLPNGLVGKDIVGTIIVMQNGTKVASIDVLAFSPFSYKPVSQFMKSMLYTLTWTMPFACLVAFVMAWIISRKNQKYTVGVQHALKQLADGEHDVVLPKTTVEENVAINGSIRNLDTQLKQHELSRREWLRSITHDLNTPVTSMKILIDGMSDGVFPINDEQVAALKKENDDLEERISAVLLYSKLLSPDTKAEKIDFPVEDLIDELERKHPESMGRIKTEYKEGTMLKGDPKLLAIAAEQLLKNALKATDKEVIWIIGDNRMTFLNEGTVDPDLDFFEPWTKGDESRGGSGNGLGLPIVKQVMRLHGGNAFISNENGKVKVEIAW